MNNINILTAILINPKKGWDEFIRYTESKNLNDIDRYKSIYTLVFIFALLPAFGHFLGMTVFPNLYIPEDLLKFLQQEQGDNQRTLIYLERLKEITESGNITKVLSITFVYYISEFLRPVIYGSLIFFLASAFEGDKNPYKAFTVAVISLIPYWMVSFFIFYNSIITAMLMFISTFYTLYLTYIAGEKFLKIPSKNSKSFQFIIVLAILYLIISSIFGMFLQNIMISKIIF